MKKILIIEDDKSIAGLERDYLQINNYECDVAERGTTGLELALANDYSLIIIDIMLPGIDGFEVCAEIRKKKQTPVIFLSARSEDIDKIRGLGLGADDYMTKPFSTNELIARVNAHIKRYELLSSNKADHSVVEFDNILLDKDAHKVIQDDNEVQLTAKEYDLLLFLVENPNRAWSKDVLFDKIWGLDALGDISTVTVHIQRLRDKLMKHAAVNRIETVWGVGYRFKL